MVPYNSSSLCAPWAPTTHSLLLLPSEHNKTGIGCSSVGDWSTANILNKAIMTSRCRPSMLYTVQTRTFSRSVWLTNVDSVAYFPYYTIPLPDDGANTILSLIGPHNSIRQYEQYLSLTSWATTTLLRSDNGYFIRANLSTEMKVKWGNIRFPLCDEFLCWSCSIFHIFQMWKFSNIHLFLGKSSWARINKNWCKTALFCSFADVENVDDHNTQWG